LGVSPLAFADHPAQLLKYFAHYFSTAQGFPPKSTMQMPESNLNVKTPPRHLLKVICGFDTRFILKFIPQIT
jgi:hypothetical protein